MKPLSPTAVALWLVQLEPGAVDRRAALRRFGHLLDENEQRQARGYASARAAVQFIYGRALVQLMLRQFLPPLAEFAGQRCPLNVAPGGKPGLRAPYDESGLEFNLSHSGHYLACAVAWRRDVGVDVESLASACDAESIAAIYYSPAEQADLARLSGAARHARFLYYWTLKEAYLKARGGSLDGQLDAIHFEPHEDGTVMVRDDFDKDADDHWGFTVVSVLPGCQVALCWERQSSCFAPAVELTLLDVAQLAALARPARDATRIRVIRATVQTPARIAPAPAPSNAAANVAANVPGNVPANVPAPHRATQRTDHRNHQGQP